MADGFAGAVASGDECGVDDGVNAGGDGLSGSAACILWAIFAAAASILGSLQFALFIVFASVWNSGCYSLWSAYTLATSRTTKPVLSCFAAPLAERPT